MPRPRAFPHHKPARVIDVRAISDPPPQHHHQDPPPSGDSSSGTGTGAGAGMSAVRASAAVAAGAAAADHTEAGEEEGPGAGAVPADGEEEGGAEANKAAYHRKRSLKVNGHLRDNLLVTLRHTAARKREPEEKVERKDIVSLLKHRQQHRKMAVEMSAYLIFLTVYIAILIIIRQPSTGFRVEEAIKQQLLQPTSPNNENLAFGDIASLDDTWEWLEEVFGPLIDQEQYYNGEDFPNELDHTLGLQLKLVAGVRLVQQRTIRDAGPRCFRTRFEPNLETTCRSAVLDTEPFSTASPAFTLTTDHGKTGYIEFIGSNRGDEAGAQVLQSLKNNTWLDENSRLLEIDITIYSSSYKQFVSVELTITYHLSGLVEPNSVVTMVPVDPYNFDYGLNVVRLILELIFLGFLLFFVGAEVHSFVRVSRCNCRLYFLGGSFAPWARLIEWSCLFLNALVIALWILIVNNPEQDEIGTLTAQPAIFISLGDLAMWQRIFVQLNAFNLIVCTLRLIRYFKLTPGGEKIIKTIGFAGPMLAAFLPLYLTIAVAFAFVGFFLFGTQLDDWRTFSRSFYRVWELNYGLYDTNLLYDPAGGIGQLYVYVVTICLVVLLLNALLAIIVFAWDTLSDKTCAPESMYEFYTTLKVPPRVVAEAQDCITEGRKAYDRDEFTEAVLNSKGGGRIRERHVVFMAEWIWQPFSVERKATTSRDPVE